MDSEKEAVERAKQVKELKTQRALSKAINTMHTRLGVMWWVIVFDCI
jgi:hypothetical protein